jgi:hypothetical protein
VPGNLPTAPLPKGQFVESVFPGTARGVCEAMPPLRPAARASSLVNSWAVPERCAAMPPRRARVLTWAGSIAAKPRFLLMGSLAGAIGVADFSCETEFELLMDVDSPGVMATANVMSAVATLVLKRGRATPSLGFDRNDPSGQTVTQVS